MIIFFEVLPPITITFVLAGMVFWSTLTGTLGANFPVDAAERMFDKILFLTNECYVTSAFGWVASIDVVWTTYFGTEAVSTTIFLAGEA